MLSKLKSRNVLISGAAFIAMVIVFVATIDLSKNAGKKDNGVIVHTTPKATTTTPITPPATPVVETPAEPVEVAASTPEPPREVSYEEAEAAYLDRNYHEATALFTRYAERKSENPWGHYMLGLSAWKSGDYENAEEAFERALELDAAHVKSYVNLGRVLIEMDRPTEALERIDSALALDTESNAGHRVRGVALQKLSQNDDAIDAYRRAIQIDPEDAWSMNNLALIYIEQERFEEALPALARAVELRDEVAIFRNNLGMALEHTGRFRAAEAEYKSAVVIDASYEKALVNLARVETVLEDVAVGPVDLAAEANSFVEAIGQWVPVSTVEVGRPAIDDDTDVAAAVSEPDTTQSGQDQ